MILNHTYIPIIKKKIFQQFRRRVKYGGNKFDAPFEDLLSTKIDECFVSIRTENTNMKLKYDANPETYEGSISIWIWIGALIFLVVSIALYTLSKKRQICRANKQTRETEEACDNVDAEKSKAMLA